MFWNKSLLKWEEPQFAKNFIVKQLSLRHYFVYLGKKCLWIAAITYIIAIVLRFLSPRKILSFFDLELLSIVLFIVAAYLIIWFITFAGSRLGKPLIYLREKGISYIAVEGSNSIAYKNLESFSIIKNKIEDIEYYVLSFKDWDGNEGFIEIDPKIDKETVIEILKSKNVQMKQSLLYPA